LLFINAPGIVLVVRCIKHQNHKNKNKHAYFFTTKCNKSVSKIQKSLNEIITYPLGLYFFKQFPKKFSLRIKKKIYIQGVSEIRVLILTGNRTRQKEQLFYLPFCRKTMFNSKKKLERFFT
jgi:hypothetical protein